MREISFIIYWVLQAQLSSLDAKEKQRFAECFLAENDVFVTCKTINKTLTFSTVTEEHSDKKFIMDKTAVIRSYLYKQFHVLYVLSYIQFRLPVLLSQWVLRVKNGNCSGYVQIFSTYVQCYCNRLVLRTNQDYASLTAFVICKEMSWKDRNKTENWTWIKVKNCSQVITRSVNG